MPQRSDMPPSKAENDAWFAYRTICHKQDREPDERTFRDAWRQGCRFTFAATSSLSPAIAAFIEWMQYVTDWSAPSFEPAEDGQTADNGTTAASGSSAYAHSQE